MAFPILAAISTGASIYGALRASRGGRRVDVNRINSKYMGMRPEGYTSAADENQLRLQLATGTRQAERGGVLGNMAVDRQIRSRKLSGASAAALHTRIAQQTAMGRESAAEGVARTRYGMYNNNLGFERNKMFKSWGAEIGQAQADNARLDSQNATMWNSIIESAPAIARMWRGNGVPQTSISPNPGVNPPLPDPYDPENN